MAEIENQRVPQRDRLVEISRFAHQHLEQLLVTIKGGVEIRTNLATLGFRIAIEAGRAGENLGGHGKTLD